MNQKKLRMILNNNIILASASPRRKELLGRIFKEFSVCPADIEETYPKNLDADKISVYLACKKAEYVFKKYPKSLVIASDTTVILGNKVFGKPSDKRDAIYTLKALSGKTHKVITGVNILFNSKNIKINSVSKVTFFDLTDKMINDYTDTPEPYDKAGSYAVQGSASIFIKKIEGSFDGIMGLPVSEIYMALKGNNII